MKLTGVSGDITGKMGEMMKQMSRSTVVYYAAFTANCKSKVFSHFKVF
jgi:hypothetical protein